MSLVSKSAPSAMVGLDIGSELIKVAEARAAKDGIKITGIGVSPTPAGAIENNIVVDPQALGAAIKQIMRESGIKTKRVVSSITGQSSVVVRIIEVPKMTKEELKETMKWEVERHVPFAPDEIIMDFAPVEKPSTPPDAQNMEVLLAVAQQDAVNMHVQTLLAAGLAPMAIDVQPLAISRPLINVLNGTLPGTVAVVNIGATTTDVGVFEGGVLAFPGPPLAIAGVNFTRAISEALGVSMEDAERLKREYSAAQDDKIDTGAADAGFDIGAPSATGEPTAFDTAYTQNDTEPSGQADTDFSAFDFGTAVPPPTQPSKPPAAARNEDVFDLGGGEPTTQFTPAFDLDEPETESVQPVPSVDAGAEPDMLEAQTEYDLGEPASATAPEPTDTQAGYFPPATDIGQRVRDALAPVMYELATEITRSIDYYATRYQNRPEQIFLCGGTAKMRGLDTFLANELGIPVQVGDPLANFTVNCPKHSSQYLNEVAPLFPICIGLAIRDMLE